MPTIGKLSRRGRIRGTASVALLIAAILLLPGCRETQQDATYKQVSREASARKPYIPHNAVEFTNYTEAQKLYDSPTTIIWCTAFPPANVSEQYRAVIEDWQSLEATAANACQAKNTPRSQRDPTLIEDPSFAYAAQYRRISVDYNRRQANFFEAEKIGPKGYPRVAPPLAQMEKRVC